MEKIKPHKYFELRKKFEDETQLKISDNKDVYVRYLETQVLAGQALTEEKVEAHG